MTSNIIPEPWGEFGPEELPPFEDVPIVPITEAEIKGYLDTLAELKAQRDILEINKKAALDGVLTPEIRAQIADIEAEFSRPTTAVAEKITNLEAIVGDKVKKFGKSVKGLHLHAIYSSGRVSWNTKALDKYAKQRPELNAFRSQGEPYVTIKRSG